MPRGDERDAVEPATAQGLLQQRLNACASVIVGVSYPAHFRFKETIYRGRVRGSTTPKALVNLLLSYSPALHGIVARGETVPSFGVTKEWKPFGS